MGRRGKRKWRKKKGEEEEGRERKERNGGIEEGGKEEKEKMERKKKRRRRKRSAINLCSMKMSSIVSASQMLRGDVSPPETHTDTVNKDPHN